MNITVDESPVGVGKTYNAIRRMVSTPGKYIFAVEKTEAIAEVAARIFEEGSKQNNIPTVKHIHSKNGRPVPVLRQLDELSEIDPDRHVIALITHEGMMMNDFNHFEGWSLIVDEVPSMFVMYKYRTPTDVAFFQENYTLTPVYDSKWHLVGLTGAGKKLDAGSISACEGHRLNWPPFRPDGFKPKKEAWGYPLSIGLCPCPRSSPTAVVAVTGVRLRS